MSHLMLDVDQAGELKAAFRRGKWTNCEIKKACQGSFLSDARQVLLGRAKIVVLETEEKTEILVDPIVRVDHSIRPVYPDWVEQDDINTPEFIALEKSGPAEFDASKLRKWWHPKQRKEVVAGNVIHAHLTGKGMLPSCLGFADLLGIQAKDIEFFRQHFKGQAVFGWRSVVPPRGGRLRVPCLVEDGGRVVLCWYWLAYGWGAGNPALRFANFFVSLLESCSGRVFVLTKFLKWISQK